MPVTFGTQVCGAVSAGGQREWLVPDGLGGYAMGTVCGLRTRRYHALQVIAGVTPATRHVGLTALDPVVILPSGARIELGVHEWAGGVIAPAGHRYLERFDLADGLPRWRWRIGDVVLERELAMAHGTPALAVVHRIVAAPGPVQLAVDALCTWRGVHGERTAGGGPVRMAPAADGVVIEDAYRLTGPGWQAAGEWWLGVHTREEEARGLNPVEDLWHAGRFAATLPAGRTLEVSAWAGDLETRPAPPSIVVSAARQRARRVVAGGRTTDAADAALVLAADTFVVGAGGNPDVVAGYPWFGAWSRDTMIAYEGLFLVTGRAAEGRRLLRQYAATLSEGMLANTADTGHTEYNTVDATLWFLHAVERHVAATGDTDLAAELAGALHEVVRAHVRGTRFGIRVDPADGLLTQGVPGYALTWMDARIDGRPVTARHGKPVEVNALWVNGLDGLGRLFEAVRRDPGAVRALHAQAVDGFGRRFPAPTGWLYDVVDGLDGDDPALRPNQLLAYSLPYPPMRPDPGPLAAVGAHLLTPLGLRSLAPGAPGYRGTHRGGPAQRDAAYHQGTVWPWWLGPFVDAAVKLGTPDPSVVAGLDAHLEEWGLHSVSETADGDPPHQATGCPFQAWSVAEVLRSRRKLGGS